MFVKELILNILFLLFPILFYFLIRIHESGLKKNQHLILFDISCVTSVYFIIYFNSYFTYQNYLFLLINVPFLLSIIYKRKLCSLIISFIIVIYYVYCFSFPFWVVFFEYFLYLFLFFSFFLELKSNSLKIYLFTILKGIFLSISFFYFLPYKDSYIKGFLYLLVILCLFLMISYVIFYLKTKIEEVANYHNVFKELKKEKAIKNALFRITHEIKNPLAVCKGYLSMMDYKDIDKIKRYHQIIKNEMERTLQLMDDFKDYHKVSIDKELMDVTYLIDECLFSMQSILETKGVEVTKNMPDEVFIFGDYKRLMQVFVNIIKNGVEAVDYDGKIDITVEDYNKSVRILFSDNGCGIDKEALEHIGELFYTTKMNGTGLGVSLSKEIIKLHKGTIYYHTKGVGTLVEIILPKGEVDKMM